MEKSAEKFLTPDLKLVAEETALEGVVRKFVFSGTGDGKKGLFELGSFLKTQDGRSRHDICVSTMAGCMMNCSMCATSFSPVQFERLLTADEIEQQARFALEERKVSGGDVRLNNVLSFMGNGEPFLNYDNVTEAARRIVEDPAFPLFYMNISTIGINPHLISALADTAFGRSRIGKIQFSLMAADPDKRCMFIPNGRGLKECLPYLDDYACRTGQRVKYNIALIDGINDFAVDADMFADFILGAPTLREAKISDFNSFDGVRFSPSSQATVEAFVERLADRGVAVYRFGADSDNQVFASCGQMRARLERYL